MWTVELVCSVPGEDSSWDCLGQTYLGGAGKPESGSCSGLEGRGPVLVRVFAVQGEGVVAA